MSNIKYFLTFRNPFLHNYVKTLQNNPGQLMYFPFPSFMHQIVKCEPLFTKITRTTGGHPYHLPNIPFKTKATFAGLSARRRIKYPYQSFP